MLYFVKFLAVLTKFVGLTYIVFVEKCSILLDYDFLSLCYCIIVISWLHLVLCVY